MDDKNKKRMKLKSTTLFITHTTKILTHTHTHR